MKKNFPLQAEGKHPDRVLEAVKHDIRKYFKRERSRPVPKDADFWTLTARSAPVPTRPKRCAWAR